MQDCDICIANILEIPQSHIVSISGENNMLSEDYIVLHPEGGGVVLGYLVRKPMGGWGWGCRGPLKIGSKKIEGTMEFWAKKINSARTGNKKIVLVLVDKKSTPKRLCSIPRGSKKGVKMAAHPYHPTYREYPTPRFCTSKSLYIS